MKPQVSQSGSCITKHRECSPRPVETMINALESLWPNPESEGRALLGARSTFNHKNYQFCKLYS